MVCPGWLAQDYRFLCDDQAAWGIVLETLAAAGVVATILLLLVLLCLVHRVSDSAKRAIIPTQFIFLLGTLGIFGLTFAFIIQRNFQTCNTRFFLFGVLFAFCFSCLLAHACKLLRLVRGGLGISGWVMLLIVLSLSLIQVLIAILYVVLVLVEHSKPCNFVSSNTGELADINKDFVLILIYVYLLMALTFLISLFTLCGPFTCWKRHGIHIYVTMFFSIAIWIVWIIMLITGNPSLLVGNTWDDPVLAIACVANGWVFLLMYMVPELCYLTRCPEVVPKNCGPSTQAQPQLLRQSYGVENRVFTQEEPNQGYDSGRSSPSSPPRFVDTLPMKEFDPSKEFTIPRPQQRPWTQYRTHHVTQE